MHCRGLIRGPIVWVRRADADSQGDRSAQPRRSEPDHQADRAAAAAFGVVNPPGRRTGRSYRTPVNVFATATLPRCADVRKGQ